MCYQELMGTGTVSRQQPAGPVSSPALSPAERRKMLEEVEQQQQDFGIQ